MIASTRIHRQNKLTALSVHIHHHLRSPPWPPSFHANNTTILAQKKINSKIELVRIGTRFPIKPSYTTSRRPRSASSSHPPRRFYAILGLPSTTTTTIDALSRVDLSILRQNWSPRAKCHSALTAIRAPNRLSYFAATVTRSSTQSSAG